MHNEKIRRVVVTVRLSFLLPPIFTFDTSIHQESELAPLQQIDQTFVSVNSGTPFNRIKFKIEKEEKKIMPPGNPIGVTHTNVCENVNELRECQVF